MNDYQSDLKAMYEDQLYDQYDKHQNEIEKLNLIIDRLQKDLHEAYNANALLEIAFSEHCVEQIDLINYLRNVLDISEEKF
jgi:hypothetical protein